MLLQRSHHILPLNRVMAWLNAFSLVWHYLTIECLLLSYMVVPTTNKFVFAISSLFGGLAPNPLNVLSDHCNLTGFNIGSTEVTWGECTYNGAIVEILLKPGTNIRYITLELPRYTPVPNEGFAVTSPFPYSWLIVPRECSNLSTAGFISEGSHTYTNTPATV